MSSRLLLLMRRRGGIVWPKASSLGALYLFDDGAGTTLTDYGPNGLHGTLGAAGAAPSWVTEGLSFDGGDNVSLPGGAALDLTGNNATLMIVMNLSAGANDGTTQPLGCYGPNPFPGYAIQCSNGTINIYTDGGGLDSSGSGDIRGASWYGFIAPLTAGTWTFYLNGNSIGSPVSGASITAYTGAKGIGSNAIKNSSHITGKVGMAAVWTTPLSSGEVATVYSNMQTIMAARGVALPDPL